VGNRCCQAARRGRTYRPRFPARQGINIGAWKVLNIHKRLLCLVQSFLGLSKDVGDESRRFLLIGLPFLNTSLANQSDAFGKSTESSFRLGRSRHVSVI
jgi:hypothetical protein